MTKEEWKRVRDDPYIPLGVWFNYYRENGGDLVDDPVEFEMHFEKVTKGMAYYSEKHGGMRYINAETARRRLTNHYDSIFGL